MLSNNRRRRIGRPTLAMIAAGAAGLTAAGIACAGPASAGQGQDDQYFAIIQQIYPSENLDRADVLANAHIVCENLANGATSGEEAAGFVKANPGDTLAQAQAETNAAIAMYCPQYR
jgi:Protein of unknown function (DUF732)